MFLASIMTLGLTDSSSNAVDWEARFEQVFLICEQFLNSYQQFHTVSRQRVALWQALNLFYYVLSGWMKVKADEISFLVKLLDRFLSATQLVDAR